MRSYFSLFMFILIVQSAIAIASTKVFYFIVHPSNHKNVMVLNRAKNIILKKISRWSNGDEIKVFLPNDKVFPLILDKLFRMDIFKWEEYWGKKSLQTGQGPPSILKSELSIIKNISKNKNGFGIITDNIFNVQLHDSIKVILKFEI